MAVFLINICKFNGCGITFPSLGDLIQHIEDTHIDYDPKVVEQKEQAQPACLPLSYVLRFISDDARKESPFISTNAAGVELKRKLAIKHHSYSMSSSNRSNTPTGSEMDEDEMVVSESEDSNDSWTTEEFSSEFIMRYGSRHSGTGSNGAPGNEKPFACPVPGCKKRYKNVNGIKYHSKNGHKKDGKVRKGYKCHCGKSYKTAQGLKSHALSAHNSSPDSVLTTQHVTNAGSNTAGGGGMLLQRSGSPSQSLGSLSPSSISNMSSSASSCHGGNNNAHSNLGCGSGNNVLHLTNGLVAANVIVGQQQQQQQSQSHQSHQQQLQQQQYNSTANSSNHQQQQQQQQQQYGATLVTAAATSESSNVAHFNSQMLPTTMHATRPLTAAAAFATPTSTFYAAPSPPPLTLPATVSTTTAAISPTFIEHKYSANTFKEKFLANLRNNQQNNNNNNNKSVQKSFNNSSNANNNGIGSNRNVIVDGVNVLSGGIGDLCSIEQHWSENLKNLFKKTIN